MRPRAAVIPAAGRGTRLLPATKAIPKELLPLGSVPALQFVLEECLRAQVRHLCLVVSPEKEALRRYLTPSVPEEGAPAELVRLEELLAGLEIEFVVQEEPLGLGHAVWLGCQALPAEPFAVLLPDEIYPHPGSGLDRLLASAANGVRLLLRRVSAEQASRFGIVAGRQEGEHVSVTGLVEKPRPEEAPSDLAVMGRYVLPPEIARHLAALRPGAGGELQLTDAIASYLAAGGAVTGTLDEGVRLDLGDRESYGQAFGRYLRLEGGAWPFS
jgi:UTP--glucose-1-phosphate uridylyltransferase